MKKLYNGKGRKVYPSPATPESPPRQALWGQLAVLPAATLALAAVLSAEEQEVLAYLLSGRGGSEKGRRNQRRSRHEPELGCGCFECYKSFWARWDASPNRQRIHHIIDAFEETLEKQEKGRGGCRQKDGQGVGEVAVAVTVVEQSSVAVDNSDRTEDKVRNGGESGCKSSVRRMVSFIGERVWGVWN